MHTCALATLALLLHLLSALPRAVLADVLEIYRYPGDIVDGIVTSDGIEFYSFDYDYDDDDAAAARAAAALPDTATATAAGPGAPDDDAGPVFDTEVQTDTGMSPIKDLFANKPPPELQPGEIMAEDHMYADPNAVTARWSGRRLLH